MRYPHQLVLSLPSRPQPRLRARCTGIAVPHTVVSLAAVLLSASRTAGGGAVAQAGGVPAGLGRARVPQIAADLVAVPEGIVQAGHPHEARRARGIPQLLRWIHSESASSLYLSATARMRAVA